MGLAVGYLACAHSLLTAHHVLGKSITTTTTTLSCLVLFRSPDTEEQPPSLVSRD